MLDTPVNRLVVTVLAVLALVGSARTPGLEAQPPEPRHLYTFYGFAPGDHYGLGGSGIADVNGDGVPDLLCANAYDDRVGTDYGSVDVRSGRTGAVLYSVQGSSMFGIFGWNVNEIGDIDADGISDFIVGSRQGNYAEVFSGVNGASLNTIRGIGPNDRLGVTVDGAGDVDGDNVPDYIVGAPEEYQGGNQRGYAEVYSGRTHRRLYRFNGIQFGDQYGTWVTGIGDVNKDGYDDVAIGAIQPQIGPGYVELRSGRDGQVLRTLTGDGFGDAFGWYVSEAGDVNNDSYPDLIIGAQRDDDNGPECGMARVISGRDGATLTTWYGDASGDQFGYAVGPAGDVDNDGYDDVFVGAVQLQTRLLGYGRLYSGKTYAMLRQFNGTNTYSLAGWVARTVGDINQDGNLDFMFGIPHDGTRGQYAGATQILSVAPLSLTTDTHEVSVGSVSTQTFYLDAGTQHADKPYLLAGSISGTSPGITVGNVTVPLNVDPYLEFTAFLAPNRAPLANSVGNINAQGYATATFTSIPAAFGPLVGLSADHAFVVFGATGLDFASNAVPVTFVP